MSAENPFQAEAASAQTAVHTAIGDRLLSVDDINYYYSELQKLDGDYAIPDGLGGESIDIEAGSGAWVEVGRLSEAPGAPVRLDIGRTALHIDPESGGLVKSLRRVQLTSYALHADGRGEIEQGRWRESRARYVGWQPLSPKDAAKRTKARPLNKQDEIGLFHAIDALVDYKINE